MERFWRYLGKCLRALTDEQYAMAREYIQSIAFAWNTTMSESLTVSPFQVMTGTYPRTLADGLLPFGKGTGGIAVESIMASAAAFT